MLNIYAFRATDPKIMLAADDPIGPDNLRVIEEETAKADYVICAWGASSDHIHEAHVKSILPTSYALGLTAKGQPRHPLYMRADTKPVRFILRKRLR